MRFRDGEPNLHSNSNLTAIIAVTNSTAMRARHVRQKNKTKRKLNFSDVMKSNIPIPSKFSDVDRPWQRNLGQAIIPRKTKQRSNWRLQLPECCMPNNTHIARIQKHQRPKLQMLMSQWLRLQKCIEFRAENHSFPEDVKPPQEKIGVSPPLPAN